MNPKAVDHGFVSPLREGSLKASASWPASLFPIALTRFGPDVVPEGDEFSVAGS